MLFCCSVHNLLSSCSPSKNIRIEVYRIIIVTCGCKYWSVTFREEHRLWGFEDRVLRNMLGPKEDEETGGWKKLRIVRFCDLYYLPNTGVLINP
jgi:hypothetical protein